MDDYSMGRCCLGDDKLFGARSKTITMQGFARDGCGTTLLVLLRAHATRRPLKKSGKCRNHRILVTPCIGPERLD